MTGYSTRDYSSGDFSAIQNVWTQTGMGGAERGDNAETIERSIGLGGRMIVLTEDSSGEIIGTSWMTFD